MRRTRGRRRVRGALKKVAESIVDTIEAFEVLGLLVRLVTLPFRLLGKLLSAFDT